MKVIADSPHARLAAPAEDPDGGPDVEVLFDDAPARRGVAGVRWYAGSQDAPPDRAERRIAPEGEGLWRRAPWPAADELFEWPASATAAPPLVAGGSTRRRSELIAAIGKRNIPVAEQSLLTPDALSATDVVVLLPSESVAGEALPLEAMCVLAARRLLITPRTELDFGLAAGIDYLDFALSHQAAGMVAEALRRPAAFASVRAWGTLAARRHRASQVFAALAVELSLELGMRD